MKPTKTELVKDIFFEATRGKRNLDNFVDGMWLIEIIAKNNYAWAIKDWYNKLSEGALTAKDTLRKMVDMTYINTSGVSGATATSKEVLRAYRKFN